MTEQEAAEITYKFLQDMGKSVIIVSVILISYVVFNLKKTDDGDKDE